MNILRITIVPLFAFLVIVAEYTEGGQEVLSKD